MAKYNKALKTIVVKTIGGTTVNAADTTAEAIASNALAEFEMFKTMHIKTGENELTLVPFHAVDNIKVTTSTSEVEKADAYGCEEEADGGDDSGNSDGE